MRLDPADHHVALEYAFLCYETKQQGGGPPHLRPPSESRIAIRATAAQAFENIDRPLAEGIARWKQALAAVPGNFSAHRNSRGWRSSATSWTLAAEHYERAWRLRPDLRELAARSRPRLEELGRAEDARRLLAASRGAEPRVAEQGARASARRAIPTSTSSRRRSSSIRRTSNCAANSRICCSRWRTRMKPRPSSRLIVQVAPDDLLSTAQLGFLRLPSRASPRRRQPLLNACSKGDDEELADRVRAALKLPQTLRSRATPQPADRPAEAKELAIKSLKAGYLKDALKYLTIAHENDPVDFDVMLKLGWTYNMLQQTTARR